jgi:hypothetical protein
MSARGKAAANVVGTTRSGKPILVPSRGAPDTNNVDTFRKTKARFADWSRGDHMDASALYQELAERELDSKLRRRYQGWGAVHWDIGGRWTSDQERFEGTRL